MKILKTLVLVVILFSFVFSQVEKNDFFVKIDHLNDLKDYSNALKLLKEQKSNYSENEQYLWRLSRAYFTIGDQNQDSEQIQKDNYYPGLKLAEKCLKINPNLAEGHQYYAILIGKIGELEGTKQKIINSYEVKKHALKAIELDPENDSNYHVMGRWNYALSELSWIEKKVAGMIYSKLPEASFEEGVKFFQQAHKLKPNELRHILWLGKSLEKTGKKDEAKKMWKKGLLIDATSDSDKNFKNQIKKALN